MSIQNFSEIIFAIKNAKKFTPLFSGIEAHLSSNQKVFLKIEKIFRQQRPTGLRFAKYSFVSKILANGEPVFGFGESNNKLIAIHKSIAEAVESTIFQAVKKAEPETESSNGWAAFFDTETAKEKALGELLERDAVLVHWLCKRPMLEVRFDTLPRWLKDWQRKELSRSNFPELRVLLSNAGYIPAITAVFCEPSGNAVMSHAADPDIDMAAWKAIAETCRIADVAVNNASQREEAIAALSEHTVDMPIQKIHPIDHALLYAGHTKFPRWIFGEKISWDRAEELWRSRINNFRQSDFECNYIVRADKPLSVVQCQSPKVQDLYIGRTETAFSRKLINEERLSEYLDSEGLYLMPHFVA